MDMSSDVAHDIVLTAYMDTACDIAHAILVTSCMDASSDVAHAIVLTSYFDTSCDVALIERKFLMLNDMMSPQYHVLHQMTSTYMMSPQ
jgi:hypothetical protein